jgi:hypothetical protein
MGVSGFASILFSLGKVKWRWAGLAAITIVG